MRGPSAEEIDRFVEDGYLVVRGAVAPEVVGACVRDIEAELRGGGVDVNDPATWTEPVVRIVCPYGPAFAAAGTAPVLWAIYDALLGPGRWRKHKGVGGTVPVRFPSERDPGDAGWHIDGSYDVGGTWWVNVHSRERGLLVLFLFGDVGVNDAPTEIIAGSHLDVPRVLAPSGVEGGPFDAVALPASTFERRRALVTGSAGDVFVCHPFMVHRATWPHRGTRPRILAQPGIAIDEPFALNPAGDHCPVERAILRGLNGS